MDDTFNTYYNIMFSDVLLPSCSRSAGGPASTARCPARPSWSCSGGRSPPPCPRAPGPPPPPRCSCSPPAPFSPSSSTPPTTWRPTPGPGPQCRSLQDTCPHPRWPPVRTSCYFFFIASIGNGVDWIRGTEIWNYQGISTS